jgi:uracil-DNA glycosylase
MGTKRTEIELTRKDRAQLEAISSDGNMAQKMVKRARVVLLTAEGLGVMAIMRETKLSKTSVWRWQGRFIEAGVAGLLKDKSKKPGKKPIADDIKRKVLETAVKRRPGHATLLEFGFATGTYAARPDDGLVLKGCMITNAVRCVPPENKPTPEEIATCRPFFAARVAALPKLQIMLALGRIAHDQTLTALGLRKAAFPFAHGARHDLGPNAQGNGRVLYDSFHCSRYNTNTRRLTPDMFRSVFAAIRDELE